MKNRILLAVSLFIGTLIISACSDAQNSSPPSITPAQAANLYNPRGNAVEGNPNGSVTLVEFFDYQCPYCRAARPIIEETIQQNPNLRVVYKEFLLFGPPSELATRAALAAQKQGKYLEMHKALISATQPLDEPEIMQIAQSINLDTKKLAADMRSEAISQQIEENTNLVNQLNINGAPTFIFANSSIATNPQTSNTQQIVFVGKPSVSTFNELIKKVSQ